MFLDMLLLMIRYRYIDRYNMRININNKVKNMILFFCNNYIILQEKIRNNRVMKTTLIFVIILFVISPYFGFCQKKNAEETIKKVLFTQEKDWNNGNLETYMQGYWKNDSLKFIGKSGIQYGWQQTLDNYKKSYPDKATMGILKFDIVKVEVLSESSAFVIGKWALIREKGNIDGYFTLLFKMVDGRWVIVCDHSS